MKNYDYVSELIELDEAAQVIKKAIDRHNISRNQRDYLFKQLKIISQKKKVIHFKIELNERIIKSEKSR